MITNALQDIDNFENIALNSDFLGKKIYTEYLSKKDVDTSSFYVIDNAIFMLSGNNITLTGNVTKENLEEIIVFSSFLGAKTIESQILNLPLEVEMKLFLMKYSSLPEATDYDVEINRDIYSFANFCCSNFQSISFDMVYSSFARKVNKGLSNIYYIKDKEKIISGAVSTEYDENTRYITFVCTDTEYRKQGYAQKIINYIATQNNDKNILLTCEYKLKDYYEKLGFKNTDIIKVYNTKGIK